MVAVGPQNEVIDIPEVVGQGGPNLYFKPACATMRDLPWASTRTLRVGEVMCEPVWKDGTVQVQNTR